MPSSYHVDYQYTARNQLKAVNGFATFSYDPSGNLLHRTATWWYDSGSNFAYDELNRVTMGEHGVSWVFARSWYQYDKAGRETATWRDEQSSKGEKFGYTTNNQLAGVQYNADQVWTGSPQTWDRSVGYTYTPDMLNRQSVNDNGTVSAYAPSGLNQYTDVGGNQLSYDNNFNQTGYGAQTTSFNALNQLISVANPASGHSASFIYDGLGRCVRRTIDGVPRLFTYDEWNPIMEWDQGGSSVAVNIYGAKADEILARADATQG